MITTSTYNSAHSSHAQFFHRVTLIGSKQARLESERNAKTSAIVVGNRPMNSESLSLELQPNGCTSRSSVHRRGRGALCHSCVASFRTHPGCCVRASSGSRLQISRRRLELKLHHSSRRQHPQFLQSLLLQVTDHAQGQTEETEKVEDEEDLSYYHWPGGCRPNVRCNYGVAN